MKRFNSKNNFIISLASLCLLSVFSSCGFDDEGIFYSVRNEIELDDSDISGDVHAIIRFPVGGDEHLFVTNGDILHRSIAVNKDSNGKTVSSLTNSIANSKNSDYWSKFANPNGHTHGLAADTTYLYALSYSEKINDDGENVGDNRYLWCYADGAWKQIWTASYSSSTSAILFGTNTLNPANRSAYFRYGSKVWKLSGTTVLSDSNVMDSTTITSTVKTVDNDPNTKPTSLARSCVYFNGSVYFSSAYSFVTNETMSLDSSGNISYTAPTYAYRIYRDGASESKDVVYYTNDFSTWASRSMDCDTIHCLAVTSDYLIAGTDSGMKHTPWESSGVPKSGNSNFSTNAASVFSSYYRIENILVVDPSLTETGTSIYASSTSSSTYASSKNIGLWSYYPTKGKWNRE